MELGFDVSLGWNTSEVLFGIVISHGRNTGEDMSGKPVPVFKKI
jgi:hypothetical protein